MYNIDTIHNNKKSFISQTSLLRELFYLTLQNDLTEDEKDSLTSSLSNIFNIMLGEDRDELPECFKGLRRLSLLPELVGTGYQKMALALINTCRSQLNYNINGSHSDNDYIARTVLYGNAEVLKALFENGRLVEQMVSSSGNTLVNALASNSFEGVLKFAFSLDCIDKPRYIQMLFQNNNTQQIEDLYKEKGEKFVLASLVKGNTYSVGIRHKKTVSLLLAHSDLQSKSTLQSLVCHLPSNQLPFEIFKMYIDQVMLKLDIDDIMAIFKESSGHIWGRNENTLYFLESIKTKASDEGYSLKSIEPEAWSRVLKLSLRYNIATPMFIYKWIIDNNIEITEMGDAPELLKLLKEIYGMTPLQMIKTSDRKFEPFIKVLAKACFANTKQSPLKLMNAVDDWVKPHLLSYLAA